VESRVDRQVSHAHLPETSQKKIHFRSS